MRTERLRIAISAISALLIAIGLYACGGGGGGSSSGTPATAVGVVSGTGSIIVNGREWSTDHAQVTIDDNTATTEDLRTGMVVLVTGRTYSATSAVASKVKAEHFIVGFIDGQGVDAGGGNFLTVMGQKLVMGPEAIEVRGGTVTKGQAGFDDLSPDDKVAVYGLIDTTQGACSVTRIEVVGRLNAPGTDTVIELRGDVHSPLTATGFELNVMATGFVHVAYDNTGTATSFDPGSFRPELDEFVVVRGAFDSATNTITAVLIKSADIDISDMLGHEIEAEGFVSRAGVAADNTFSVVTQSGNAPVLIGPAVFASDPTIVSLLLPGTKVEVMGNLVQDTRPGALQGDYILLALRIRIEDRVATRCDVMLEANIEEVSTTDNSIVLFGIKVFVDNLVPVDNSLVGQHIAITGLSNPDNTVTACRTSAPEPAAVETVLQGTVASHDNTSKTLTILGITVDLAAAKMVKNAAENPTDVDTFLSLLQDGVTVVKAKSSKVGAFDSATGTYTPEEVLIKPQM